MPRPPILPNFVRCFAAAGADALRGAAGQLREFQLRAPIDVTLESAESLAADYLAKLNYHHHLFSLLPDEAQDRVALEAGLPAFPDFVAPEGTERDREFYAWETAVNEVLFVREPPPPPLPRPPAAASPHLDQWPELASLDAYSPARAEALSADLARSLGPEFAPLGSAGTLGLPCVLHTGWDLAFIAIPGGTFQMGMTEEEEQELRERVMEVSPDSADYIPEAAACARPVRMVRVRPFLCARTPWLERHSEKLGVRGDPRNSHRALRMEMDPVFEALSRLGVRLLSEAEWEWIARAGGTRSWLSGDQTPPDWAEMVTSGPPESHEDTLGIQGIGWGEWVDDGWHEDYQGAPETSDSWDPLTDLQTYRGGPLAVWPWQGGGELVLCHAALRELGGLASIHAVGAALELPARV